MSRLQSYGVPKRLKVDASVPFKILRVPNSVASAWRAAPPNAIVSYLCADEEGKESVASVAPSVTSSSSSGNSLGWPAKDSAEWFEVRKSKPENQFVMARETEVPDESDDDSENEDDAQLPEFEILEVRGAVTESKCLIPRMSGHYQAKWKSRLLQVRDEKTAVEETDGRRGEPGASAAAHVFRYYAPGGEGMEWGDGTRASSGRKKRQRVQVTMTTEDLQKRLFVVLESAPAGLSLTELVRKTGQPQRIVRETVERISEFRKHKYTLKAEYGSQRSSSEGTTAAAPSGGGAMKGMPAGAMNPGTAMDPMAFMGQQAAAQFHDENMMSDNGGNKKPRLM